MSVEVLYTAGLALLESTFVFVGLLILHGLRRLIGSAPLYMFLGVLLVMMNIAGAAGLRMILSESGVELSVSTSILLLPFLAILLVIYIVDGTLAAQRLIIAAMATFGIFAYLSWITKLQSEWGGFTMSQGHLADYLSKLLGNTSRNMGASLVALTLDLFLIPMIFQKMKNYGCRLTVCAIGAILLGQLVDSFIFVGVLYWGDPQKMAILNAEYVPRIVLALWISFIAAVYLSRIDREIPGDSRRALDIVLAFFGSYGKTKLLEQNLRESEQRYRTIIQNASDMILVTDSNGIIVDANKAAQEVLSARTMIDLIGCNLDDFLLRRDTLSQLMSGDESVTRISLPESSRELELSMSRIAVDGTPALVFIGRDITERERLAKERELLRMESAHRQRLEAIGRLAGGIAHDFNNYIHAIQGHLDIIKYMHEVQDEDIRRNLDKIDHITELAGTLTSQMLSFARKGNYQNVDVDIRMLVDKCAELFLPGTQSGITFRIIDDGRKYIVRGDAIQLQQTLLNLMINAKDAMQSNPDSEEQILTIRIGEPHAMGIELDPPPEVKLDSRRKLCAIRVEDTGTGIDPAVKARVFEPFFTTKPVGKGTGMGLAMAYGTILAHNGWLQCCNLPGRGAAFDIILPIEQQISENNGGESL